MGNEKDLFFEEAVLDDLSQHDFNSLERPLSHTTFTLVGAAVLLIVGIVAVRILTLGVWQGDFYAKRAAANVGQISVLRAERGIIVDRYGAPLTKNIPSFRVALLLAEYFKDPSSRGATLQKAGQILGLTPDYMENLLRDVDLETQGIVTLARDITLAQTIQIKGLQSPMLEVQNDFRREYLDPEQFAHVVGYVGAANRDDIAKNDALLLDDVLGKQGLEAFYDSVLRGTHGETVRYRNARGETIDQRLARKPAIGSELHTTIDAELQKMFFEKLQHAVTTLGSRAGVGIAMDPRTGEVLSLISLPSFDNNNITQEVLQNPLRPLFNRAIGGVYTPGSTIKPLHALAALSEGVVTKDTRIFSPGYLELPNPYVPEKPSRFLDWKAHGWVDLVSAIARSSNVYFYTIGGGFEKREGLGITRLKDYWERFGLGERTGIDLPSEARGFLPDPALKESMKHDIWRVGDTYNVSIGQGDLLITPLQLLNYISLIANGGVLYEPFLVNKIVGGEAQTIQEIAPHVLKNYSSIFSNELPLIQKGMRDVVAQDYGTAYSLSALPFDVAAKTGTAQIADNSKTNAFFVGYGPVGEGVQPELAILILVEDSKDGSTNTVPVARDVFQWYYENRMK